MINYIIRKHVLLTIERKLNKYPQMANYSQTDLLPLSLEKYPLKRSLKRRNDNTKTITIQGAAGLEDKQKKTARGWQSSKDTFLF